ncbi:MAG: sugar phosphate isomerase/epimerase [Flavobacteriaceae bacterium]|nr:sugar phosphate isomerase/epimerase [Flavobacteriaceae bacterium]
MNRRDFISKTTKSGLALSTIGLYGFDNILARTKNDLEPIDNNKLFFKISLAQWSLHNALFEKKMTNLDFAAKARSFGFEGLEYVNSFFKDKAKDMSYLKEMNSRAASEGLENVLIMIDGEGNLAETDNKLRLKGIENHYKWVEAAHFLGCHAIRVNLRGGKNKQEAMKTSIDSLNRLSDFAKGSNINILVENHGGFSSNGDWMTKVFSQISNKNVGTLPDFGNFCIERKGDTCINEYDRYKGMEQLLVYAKAVSAKSNFFDEDGNEKNIDYYRIMKMVKEVGYKGFVGVEFEGVSSVEEKGIKQTRDLLIKVGKQLS